jgi:hypothetical protein
MRPGRAFSLVLPSSLSVCCGLFAALLSTALTGCGKGTVQEQWSDPGFSSASFREDTALLVVSGPVQVVEFKQTFREAFASESDLLAHLAARLLDSLNHGTPAIPVRTGGSETGNLFGNGSAESSAQTALGMTAANWENDSAHYVIRIRNITVGNAHDSIPVTLIPAGPQGEMVPGGGGETESCVVSFALEVWEKFDEDGTVGRTRRAAFTVSGKAPVVLFAYRSALDEAFATALNGTLGALRKMASDVPSGTP